MRLLEFDEERRKQNFEFLAQLLGASFGTTQTG